MLAIILQKDVRSEIEFITANKITWLSLTGDFVLYHKNGDIVRIIDPYSLEVESFVNAPDD